LSEDIRDQAIDFLRKAQLSHALRRELALKYFEERGWPADDVTIYNQATDQEKAPCTLGRIIDRDAHAWVAEGVATWDHEAGEWVEIKR